MSFWVQIYNRHSPDTCLIYTTYPVPTGLVRLSIPEHHPDSDEFMKSELSAFKQILNMIIEKKRQRLTPREHAILNRIPRPHTQAQLSKIYDQIYIQQGLVQSLLNVSIKPNPEIAFVRHLFNENDIPLYLAHLPYLFSSDAHQHPKDLWTLPHTFAIRTLTVDAAVDERLDPILATYAVVDFLKSHHRQSNSWALAIDAFLSFYESPSLSYGRLRAITYTLAKQKSKINSIDLESQRDFWILPRPYYFQDLPFNQKDLTAIIQLNSALRPIVLENLRPIPAGYKVWLPLNRTTEQPFSETQPRLIENNIAPNFKKNTTQFLNANRLSAFINSALSPISTFNQCSLRPFALDSCQTTGAPLDLMNQFRAVFSAQDHESPEISLFYALPNETPFDLISWADMDKNYFYDLNPNAPEIYMGGEFIRIPSLHETNFVQTRTIFYSASIQHFFSTHRLVGIRNILALNSYSEINSEMLEINYPLWLFYALNPNLLIWPEILMGDTFYTLIIKRMSSKKDKRNLYELASDQKQKSTF